MFIQLLDFLKYLSNDNITKQPLIPFQGEFDDGSHCKSCLASTSQVQHLIFLLIEINSLYVTSWIETRNYTSFDQL